MAHATLPSHNSNVHPIFQPILDNIVGQEIARVDRILAQSNAYTERMEFWRIPHSPQTELVTCCADQCRERATVEELATGLEYCLMHFREVNHE